MSKVKITSNFEVRSISMQDREEIRRRLAMESDFDDRNNKGWKSSTVGHKKGYLNKLMTNTSDLRLCFFNKTPDHYEETRDLERLRQDAFNRITEDFNKKAQGMDFNNNEDVSADENQLVNELERCNIEKEKPHDLMVNLRRNKMERFRYILNTARPNDMSTFHRYHNLIIAEARFALSQAKEMAQMQMETERSKVKPNPVAELIQLPVDRHFNKEVLKEMSVPKLQIIVNDLLSQIEALNEELVQMLQERDELHMEQDSILVDIEDATIFLLKRMKHQNSRSLELTRKASH